jgi:hypothetical protein
LTYHALMSPRYPRLQVWGVSVSALGARNPGSSGRGAGKSPPAEGAPFDNGFDPCKMAKLQGKAPPYRPDPPPSSRLRRCLGHSCRAPQSQEGTFDHPHILRPLLAGFRQATAQFQPPRFNGASCASLQGVQPRQSTLPASDQRSPSRHRQREILPPTA